MCSVFLLTSDLVPIFGRNWSPVPPSFGILYGQHYYSVDLKIWIGLMHSALTFYITIIWIYFLENSCTSKSTQVPSFFNSLKINCFIFIGLKLESIMDDEQVSFSYCKKQLPRLHEKGFFLVDMHMQLNFSYFKTDVNLTQCKMMLPVWLFIIKATRYCYSHFSSLLIIFKYDQLYVYLDACSKF